MPSTGGLPRRRSSSTGSTPPRERFVIRVKMNQISASATITATIAPMISAAPAPLLGAFWLFWAMIVTASVVIRPRFPVRTGAMRLDSPAGRAGTGDRMDTENKEGLPPDDGAVEERGTGELGGAGVAGGAGEGTPGGPEGSPYEPGEGPTAGEETGITGDPDEEETGITGDPDER
jgi:hypothetical protein